MLLTVTNVTKKSSDGRIGYVLDHAIDCDRYNEKVFRWTDWLLISNAKSTATVMSRRNTSHQATSNPDAHVQALDTVYLNTLHAESSPTCQ